MTTEEKLTQLKEEAKKLEKLLEDPQYGLLVWWGFLKQRLEAIDELRNQLGFTK